MPIFQLYETHEIEYETHFTFLVRKFGGRYLVRGIKSMEIYLSIM
jgi:uncharacterized protein (DUF1330 family)